MTPSAQMWGPLEKAFRLQVDMSIQYLITPDKINTQYKHFFRRKYKQEAVLLQKDHATRYVSKFVLCFTRYGSSKGFKQQT